MIFLTTLTVSHGSEPEHVVLSRVGHDSQVVWQGVTITNLYIMASYNDGSLPNIAKSCIVLIKTPIKTNWYTDSVSLLWADIQLSSRGQS